MIVRIGTNALAEVVKFVAIRCAPGGAEARVATQCAVFKGLSCLNVEDGEGQAVKDRGRGPSAYELGREGAS